MMHTSHVCRDLVALEISTLSMLKIKMSLIRLDSVYFRPRTGLAILVLFYDCTDVPISPFVSICLLLMTSAPLTGNLHLQVIDDRRDEDVLILLCAGDHRSEYVPKPKGKTQPPSTTCV